MNSNLPDKLTHEELLDIIDYLAQVANIIFFRDWDTGEITSTVRNP